MKKFFGVFIALFTMMAFAVTALAQDLPVPIPEVANSAFFEALLAAIGGIKGASTLTIVGIVLQLLFKLFGTPMFAGIFNKLQAKAKFIVIGVLSIASLTVAEMQVAGVSVGVALLHGAVVTAIMNYAYRFYELFIETKNS